MYTTFDRKFIPKVSFAIDIGMSVTIVLGLLLLLFLPQPLFTLYLFVIYFILCIIVGAFLLFMNISYSWPHQVRIISDNIQVASCFTFCYYYTRKLTVQVRWFGLIVTLSDPYVKHHYIINQDILEALLRELPSSHIHIGTKK